VQPRQTSGIEEEPTMRRTTNRPSHIRRALVVAVAGATLGVTGAFAVAEGNDDPSIRCGPTAGDLMRAADAARRLEAERPDLFAGNPRPADYEDLRLAADWARRSSSLRPIEGC
jgi:hypothetical protein